MGDSLLSIIRVSSRTWIEGWSRSGDSKKSHRYESNCDHSRAKIRITILKMLNPPTRRTATNLYLHPADPMSRPLVSDCVPSNDLVLKLTVPKVIGRKRKGAADSEVESLDVSKKAKLSLAQSDGKDILRRLRDNEGRCKVEVVGKVDRSHHFRSEYQVKQILRYGANV